MSGIDICQTRYKISTVWTKDGIIYIDIYILGLNKTENRTQ